jgi:peptidyl-tRNA hydrolase
MGIVAQLALDLFIAAALVVIDDLDAALGVVRMRIALAVPTGAQRGEMR